MLDRAALSVGAQLEAEAEVDGVRLLATLAVDGHGAAIVPATAVPAPLGQLRRGPRARSCRPESSPSRRTRRPGPSGAVKALFDVLRAALPARALEQAGVRLGSDAFPLLRSAR